MISCRAHSLGPAAALALSRGPTVLRVVGGSFRSTLNLEVEGTGELVSLRGPPGAGLPHEVLLERAERFERWRVADGSRGVLEGAALHIPTGSGIAAVDLRRARRRPRRTLPPISRPGAAHRACTERLAKLQDGAGCELRMAALLHGNAPATALGARLRDAARALADAARGPLPPLRRAVALLTGLGPGLTPAGDDFLCGFLAAARALEPGSDGAAIGPAAGAGGAGLASFVAGAIGESLGRTNRISAFLLRCAIAGFWPEPLVDLAEALARGREPDALAALGRLCRLGHSSGSDLATGFLFGMQSLARRS